VEAERGGNNARKTHALARTSGGWKVGGERKKKTFENGEDTVKGDWKKKWNCQGRERRGRGGPEKILVAEEQNIGGCSQELWTKIYSKTKSVVGGEKRGRGKHKPTGCFGWEMGRKGGGQKKKRKGMLTEKGGSKEGEVKIRAPGFVSRGLGGGRGNSSLCEERKGQDPK